MTAPNKTGKHPCQVCGKPFSSWQRLEHHWAAEHAPSTSADIRRSRHLVTLAGLQPKRRKP